MLPCHFASPVALAQRGIIGVRGYRVIRGVVRMGEGVKGSERGF